MDDSDVPLDVPPTRDDSMLNQASRNELLDISSNAVFRAPADPIASGDASSSYQGDEADPQLRISAEEEDNLHVVLAMNEAMSELVNNMLEKAELSLKANLEKQKTLEERKKIFNSNAAMVKRKVPVVMFMPPYFKDQFNMCPPQNSEMKRKLECMIYDPLLKEEKKWSEADLRTLRRAVRDSIIEERLLTLNGKRDIIREKIRAADATTTAEERQEWNDKIEYYDRKIEFEKCLTDDTILTGDYSKVDWATIAMVHFKGHRTPASLKLKWCNEQSPQWSKAEWTATEVKKLNELTKTDFVSWSLIADKLGTRRTPWQCFEKYKSEIASEILKREWTQEEDDRLVKLVESLQLNGVIQWDKVTYHMAGRTRQQCRTRFLRTLDKSIKHGRWTDEEDLLLMCSIGRYGAKDWRKIAKGVPGRNDGQCRERWVNVLDRANRSEEWTMEEDEKLLYAVNMFGKGQWAKISRVLPGRNQRICKARFRSLMTTKMRICAAQLSKIREAQAQKRKGNIAGLRMYNRPAVVFKEFNALVGGDDETGEEFCNQARAASQRSGRGKNKWKVVEPEVRRIVEEGMQGISKKYQDRQSRWSNYSDGEELFNELEQLENPESRRKQPAWLPVQFDPEVTEEEKTRGLMEALCQVVGKQDQLRSVNTQQENDERARMEIEEKLKRILVDAVESRVEKALTSAMMDDDQPMTSMNGVSNGHSLEASIRLEMESEADTAANDMLHPTATTTHAAELLLVELPRIAEIATPLLSCLWSGEKLRSMEEVLVHLNETLKHHKEYVELREMMRCLLVEPLMLIFSLEDDEHKKASLVEKFNEYRNQLMADIQDGKVMESDKPIPYTKVPKTLKTPRTPRVPSTKMKKKNEIEKKTVEETMDKEDNYRPHRMSAEERKKIWDAIDDEEIPVDWEVPEEQPDSVIEPLTKSTPSGGIKRRQSSMGGKSEKKVKKPPVKRSRSAKSAAAEDSENEEEEEGEEMSKPSVTRGRSTLNSSWSMEDVVGEKEDEETEDEGRNKKTPAKSRKSVSRVKMEKKVEVEKKVSSSRGRGRPRKSNTPDDAIEGEMETGDKQKDIDPPKKEGEGSKEGEDPTGEEVMIEEEL
ncbi:snpc-4 [Pristionchus pacificus]|uniref:Snpc-4 n=1 Tax=Pristionchus pacificus TaxID=54126 RepID=A0A2A6CS34_PRIPA|nr:snpc-4 [Pristionchus pacificus]|eukprot:PDM80853.1 snpc-4 [Pristionchus pacificus]